MSGKANYDQIKKHLVSRLNSSAPLNNETVFWLENCIEHEIWTRYTDFEGVAFKNLADWLAYSPPPGCGVPNERTNGDLSVTIQQLRWLCRELGRTDLLEHLPVSKTKAGRKSNADKENGIRTARYGLRDGKGMRKATLETRLREEHPKVWRDYCNGLYRSVRQAAESTTPPLVKSGHDALMRMKAYWKNASESQRDEFRKWLRTSEAKECNQKNTTT